MWATHQSNRQKHMATKPESKDEPPEKAPPAQQGGWQGAFESMADALDALANGEPDLRWQNHLNFMSALFRNQSKN
jgi:hypothetical protein